MYLRQTNIATKKGRGIFSFRRMFYKEDSDECMYL